MTEQMSSVERTAILLRDRKSSSFRMSGVFQEFGPLDWPDRPSKYARLSWVIPLPGETGRTSTCAVTPSRPFEEVADWVAQAVQEYLNTTFMLSARQLVFDDAIRQLRVHTEAIAELKKQQSVLTRQVRGVQEAGSSEAAERVALGPFSDRIERAVGVALAEAGVGGVAEFDGDRLTFRIPPESEESLIEGEFELYRVLARELPLNVFRALDIDAEILE